MTIDGSACPNRLPGCSTPKVPQLVAVTAIGVRLVAFGKACCTEARPVGVAAEVPPLALLPSVLLQQGPVQTGRAHSKTLDIALRLSNSHALSSNAHHRGQLQSREPTFSSRLAQVHVIQIM